MTLFNEDDQAREIIIIDSSTNQQFTNHDLAREIIFIESSTIQHFTNHDLCMMPTFFPCKCVQGTLECVQVLLEHKVKWIMLLKTILKISINTWSCIFQSILGPAYFNQCLVLHISIVLQEN